MMINMPLSSLCELIDLILPRLPFLLLVLALATFGGEIIVAVFGGAMTAAVLGGMLTLPPFVPRVVFYVNL